MKFRICLSLMIAILVLSLLCVESTFAGRDRHNPHANRTIDPIVSTEWLSDNIYDDKLVIIDIRDPGSYGAGHIPGALNEPFVTAFDNCAGPGSNWIVGTQDCLWLELPDIDDLFNTIGALGITNESWAVIITAPNPGEPPFYGLANGTRVADTLIYAGLTDVAILDGGYPKWVADGLPTDMDVPIVTPVTYSGDVSESMFVSIDYVRRHLRSADIVDARDPDVYFGVTIEPYAADAGHIPNASSLPTPWIWDLNPDGTYTYKDSETLAAMASGVLGNARGYHGHWGHKKIVYCGVGGYASSWWFVLTQVLGYKNVKYYDGSAQEWVLYYDMVPYRWD